MIRPLSFLATLSVGAALLAAAEPPKAAANPVIHADVPDMAMVRVGDTYYMSSTTMHMSPGLPIMKSKDLVNWEIVGYAYDVLDDDDALDLANGKNAYGRGSWASSLRHHDGTFYVTTFSGTTARRTSMRRRTSRSGPWKATSFEPSLHDHSLFFDDDGRVYMIYGGGNLRLVELDAGPDRHQARRVRRRSSSRTPAASAGANIMLPAEGSQLLKHDGKYYLFNITWPRGGMRTVLVHRADRITGPYEGRVALQDKGVAQGVAHRHAEGRVVRLPLPGLRRGGPDPLPRARRRGRTAGPCSAWTARYPRRWTCPPARG